MLQDTIPTDTFVDVDALADTSIPPIGDPSDADIAVSNVTEL